MLLISSLLFFSILQGKGKNIFTDEDYIKIISVSKTDCLEKKIQFTVEFEEKNLKQHYLEFKLNLQSKYNLDTFFAYCIFEVPQDSQKAPKQMNYENNNEKQKTDSEEIYQIKKSQKLKSYKKAVCSYDSLYKQGKYILKTNPENNNVIIEKEIELELIPCDFRNLSLCFRQVNSFKYDEESKSLSFIFSGLSSSPKNADEIISFWILLYVKGQKELEPVETKCNLVRYSSIEEVEKDFAIKPVVFSCSYIFNREGELEEPYMKLYSSEYLTGFPTEPELLYPFFVDLFIKNGSLLNFSEPLIFEIVPAVIEEPKYNFDNFSEKGILEITAEVRGNFESSISFNIPLISPKTHLNCEIFSYINNIVTINCRIKEDEIDNKHIIFEQIIVKEKKKELFVLPSMKFCKFSKKIMRGIKVEEKLDDEKIKLKNYKQLPDSPFNIYEDTYKCIYDSEIKSFYINGNKEKHYIFVSVSNSNLYLVKDYKIINSKNYIGWNHPEYDTFHIISQGIGCFQVYYLEDEYFTVGLNNKYFSKSFNILNSETVQFKIRNDFGEKLNRGDENKITIYIYCLENNFVKKLQIDEKYQELEIFNKNAQYYYQIEYNGYASDHYLVDLYIDFNLNNKDKITITLEIKLNYIDPIVWMCVTLGSVAAIPILYFIIKYIVKCFKKRKKHLKIINRPLIQLNEDEKEYEIYKKEEYGRIKKEKKVNIRQRNREKIQRRVNQVVQRASFVYDCIQKDYNLINHTCLLCAKNDKIPSLIELNDEYKDYEEEDEEEEEDDDDNCEFENSIDNYDQNINRSINIIDDINKGKYKSFMDYISPKRCKHFYHKSCIDEFKQAYYYFRTPSDIKYCSSCRIFLTIENMQKFGCFFSKEFFVDYFRDTINNEFKIRMNLARKNIIGVMENIFYSKIEKSLIIDEDKKWRINFIKKLNNLYLEYFTTLHQSDKYINYYRFYELSIDEDLPKEFRKFKNELKEFEKIERINIKKKEEREREENERREREENERNEREEIEENRKRERREREELEENRRRKIKEEKEKRRPVYLYRCCFCGDKCLFCGGKISGSGRNKNFIKAVYYYKAHGSCIPNNDNKCVICHKTKGTIKCNNQCYNCFDKRDKIQEKCYYCKEKLIFWDK